MKIEKLILENFRSYRDKIAIDFRKMNVFVGKNDIEKSTILEALDIFLMKIKGQSRSTRTTSTNALWLRVTPR